MLGLRCRDIENLLFSLGRGLWRYGGGTDEPHPSKSLRSGRPFVALSQRLDELRRNRMIRLGILASDEFAIDDYIGREIRPGAHLAASGFERVRHVEIHLRVKDVVFDPLFFGGREDGHVVASILPAVSPIL